MDEVITPQRRYLYRYYSNLDYILDVLRHRRLYNNLPSEFNDPFDCRPLFSLAYNNCNDREVWRRFLFCLAKIALPNASKGEFDRHAQEGLDAGLPQNKKWLRERDEELREPGGLIRVCCFAKNIRNMMLWAHYANNHQGLAFMFRSDFLVDKMTKEFRGQDVHYRSGAYKFTDFVDALFQGVSCGRLLPSARIIYSSKTQHWSGEQEVRFFSTRDHLYSSFQEQGLYGIVFGAKCGQHLIDHVESALVDWETKPQLFKASIPKSTHRLWIEKY
jgi:hypothetical protein